MHKFSFTCKRCNEEFNVDFEYIPTKDSLICPNCSNILPNDSFQHLKNIVKSLEEYEKSGVDGYMEKQNHFTVTIH